MFGLSTSDSINVIGILLSLLSLIFGFFQYWRKKEIQRLVANDAIEIHEIAAMGLGAIQYAKGKIQGNQIPLVEIGITEGYLQSLATGTAKMYCNIQKTTIEDINEMVKNKQLKENFLSAFLQYSVNQKRGYLRNFLRWLKKIW